MLIVLTSVIDRAIKANFGPFGGTIASGCNAYNNFNFPNFGRHLQICQKWKMSIILKTIRDSAISGKFWTLWVI